MKRKKTRKRKVNSLYIHIPFCRHLCPYCDFTKLISNDNFEDQYVNQLLRDLSSLEGRFFKFRTVFIGGGTPSSLKHDNLEKILKKISKLKSNDAEFTIEANPEDINITFLELSRKYGINRISIGIQTFNEEILSSIKRNYQIDYQKMISSVKLYIKNINLDFIYGLPGYDVNILKNDLESFFKLDVNHASFYSLIVSPGTEYFNKKVKEDDEDKSRLYYDLILKEMRKHGFERYEVSNFAKPGFECKHNLNYWHNREYVGLGLGSSGYESNIRYVNTKNFNDYIKGINSKEIEKITNKTLEEYYFITNLRLHDGFKLLEYKKIFGVNFLDKYKEKIENLKKMFLISYNNDSFYCTDEGLIVLDFVLGKLIF